MKKRVLGIVLVIAMLLCMIPAASFAETKYVACIGEGAEAVKYETLEGALNAAEEFDSVFLLDNIDLGSKDLVIPDFVFLDLNHFTIKTSGETVNNGTIVFHKENIDQIEYWMKNVEGSYGTAEAVKTSEYVFPEASFFTNEICNDVPLGLELDFAIEDGFKWNKDVEAGMQLRVTDNLILGGDIISGQSAVHKDTFVNVRHFTLGDNITIGTNSIGYGDATLFVESLHDDFIGDEIGTFKANGKKIILNGTGKFVISSDIKFDEKVLVSGVAGKEVQKKVDENTITYYVEPSFLLFTPKLVGTTYDKCDKGLACPLSRFKDLSSLAWYHNGIHYCLDNGYMVGTKANEFSPLGATTRAQVVNILWNLAGKPKTEITTYFFDIDPNSWYAEALSWANNQGIVTGIEPHTFGGDLLVTREQLATMLYKYAKSHGEGIEADWYFLLKFDDTDLISSWADEAVHWCYLKAVLTGKSGNILDPKGNLTRAEAASMIQRFCER